MSEHTDFIHRFVPTEVDGAPTLLLLHGTGGNETDLLELGRTLMPGAALLSPRGKVLERGMPRFFRRLAEGVFDLEDLKYRTAELAHFVAGSAAIHHFDPRNVIAVGYSNGANIAASLMLLHPAVLAAAILFRPMVPLEPETGPDLRGKQAFIAAARFDQLVPPQQSERLAELLQAAGADVTLHWQPGTHALAAQDVEAATAWLAQFLQRAPTQ